jgi:phosphoesterase RecJ-like protein
MALSLPEQLKTLIENKKHILVTFRKNASGDAIGSAIALALMIERMGRTVDIVSADFVLPKAYAFLPLASRIGNNFSHLQKFIITLDVRESGVEELSYDLKDEKLRIFITPKHGILTRDQVRTAQTDFKYDLIVTLDTEDLSSLGSLYDNNTDLFYKTPIVNIDHNSANEHYGHVNIIDMTATSTAEVLFDTMKQMNEELIDTHMATALLAGMIAKTHSFKTDNVTPRTLATASTLVTLGANREEIVHHLYRTRSIATLKLWGFALSHMQVDHSTGLVWSTITRDDFVRSGATEDDLSDIVSELISSAPEAKVIILLHEHETDHAKSGLIHGLIHTTKGYQARDLASAYDAKGNNAQASFTITGKTLTEAEMLVTEHVRTLLKSNKE